jgi:hypothetical protein
MIRIDYIARHLMMEAFFLRGTIDIGLIYIISRTVKICGVAGSVGSQAQRECGDMWGKAKNGKAFPEPSTGS